MKFGENLKLIRKSKKISQEELAERLGVSRQSVSKWETGENYPSMQNIMCLCTIFKCKINELVHEDFVDINFLDDEIKMSVVKFKKEEQKKMKGISSFISIVGKITEILSIMAIIIMAIATIASTCLLANTSFDTANNNIVIAKEKYDYKFTEEELIIIDSSGEKLNLNIDARTEKETVEKIFEMSKGVRISLALFIELSLIFALFTLNRLSNSISKLFKNIHDKETPFDMENVKLIKRLALFTLLYIFSQDLLGSIAQGIYNLEFNIEIEITNYILVLIVFAISYVFKYGYEIQLDSNGKIYGDENE